MPLTGVILSFTQFLAYAYCELLIWHIIARSPDAILSFLILSLSCYDGCSKDECCSPRFWNLISSPGLRWRIVDVSSFMEVIAWLRPDLAPDNIFPAGMSSADEGPSTSSGFQGPSRPPVHAENDDFDAWVEPSRQLFAFQRAGRLLHFHVMQPTNFFPHSRSVRLKQDSDEVSRSWKSSGS